MNDFCERDQLYSLYFHIFPPFFKLATHKSGNVLQDLCFDSYFEREVST